MKTRVLQEVCILLAIGLEFWCAFFNDKWSMNTKDVNRPGGHGIDDRKVTKMKS